ncbi:hypothetical protein [Arthrobacter gyeryongensis]|uniref:hypothetical protein n=1 Tax=Arthrobacter gyeryongensis TaxID=1650592 RepID=UPI0031E75BC8
MGVDLLDGSKAADLSLEAFDGCALLTVLGLEVLDGGGLGAEFVLKEILGLIAGGESRRESGSQVSKMSCRFDDPVLGRSEGQHWTRSGSTVPSSTIPLSVAAAGGTKPLRRARRVEGFAAFLAILPVHDPSSRWTRSTT